MPSAWSEKDERQYERIRRSSLERGESEERAREIAARTVNKHRREEGRTPHQETRGTGNPHSRLEERTVQQLRNRASQLHVSGRSKMKKDELIDAIRARE
jgi:plasmid stabilization system protein ParE